MKKLTDEKVTGTKADGTEFEVTVQTPTYVAEEGQEADNAALLAEMVADLSTDKDGKACDGALIVKTLAERQLATDIKNARRADERRGPSIRKQTQAVMEGLLKDGRFGSTIEEVMANLGITPDA